jgi:hypothetical protein
MTLLWGPGGDFTIAAAAGPGFYLHAHRPLLNSGALGSPNPQPPTPRFLSKAARQRPSPGISFLILSALYKKNYHGYQDTQSV